VQGLLRRHLVSRSEHHADGRSHVLSLTDEGRGLHSEIAPLALAYESALLDGLSLDEVSLLRRLLERLQGAAATLAGEGQPPALGAPAA
jgi:DNA-binding MarR family transcriptional regulator